MNILHENKFKKFETYSQGNDFYCLLPFKFHRLDERTEILVNEVGDYITVPTGSVEKIIKRRVDPLVDANLYADLISMFFISEQQISPLSEILETRYRTKKSFLDSFTGLHIFVITLRCDHSCQYCQVSRVSFDRDRYDMSNVHIDKGIAMMMRSPNPHVTMEFQGGEALLAFSKIMYAVEKTKELAPIYHKDITYVICTNLSFITDEILEYCNINNILISTSLDGPEYVHNINRKKEGNDSYQITIRGIEKSKAYLGNDRVSALMTTSPLSLQYPEEIVEEYYQQGFREIFLRPISPYGFAKKTHMQNRFETERFLEFYKKALDKILAYNYQGERFVEIYTKIILEKILTPFPVGYVDLSSPAGIINSVIVFNYDGKVYTSDEARMLAEINDFTFLLGDLDTNSYEDIFYGKRAQEIALSWSTESLAGCSECAFQAYCGADPVRYHATQGDMYGYRPNSPHCLKNMEIIRYIFELMESDQRIKSIFRNWIASN